MQKLISTPILGPIIVLAVWWVTTQLHFVSPILLPRLDDTLWKFYSLLVSAKAFPDIWSTVYRTMVGLGIASFFGIITGLFIGTYTEIYKTFGIVIDFFRSLPATAMFPLFLLIFGIGSASKIAIAIFISFWVILLHSAYGVIHSSRTRTKVARSLGATNWQIFKHVTVMEALPNIVVGLKTAISLSLIVVVVSEMFIGSSNGLGQKIYDSYLTYESPNLYAWLIITGIVGYLINAVFSSFERKVLHWVGR